MAGDDEQLNALLLFESERAWEHYRHIEMQVHQFLAFYGAILSAYVGLVAVLATQNSPSAAGDSLFAAGVMGAMVATLGTAMLLQVNKLRHARNFYGSLITGLRRRLFTAAGQRQPWEKNLDVYQARAAMLERLGQQGPLVRWQFGFDVESLFEVTSGLLALVPFAVLGLSDLLSLQPWQTAIDGTLCVFTSLLFLRIVGLRRLRRDGFFWEATS